MESVSSSLIPLAEWPPEGLSEREVVFEGAPQSLILHRDGSRLRGWLNICPHAGRRLDYAPGQFLLSKGLLVCAAHGASFEMPGGLCVAGPCRGQSLREVELQPPING